MTYLDHCITEPERQAVSAWIEFNSLNKAADHLGKAYSTVQEQVKRVKDRAALKGYSPENDMTHTAPDTHVVRGTSTLYDQDGNPRLQWVKTNVKLDDQLAVVRATADALAESLQPYTPVAPPSSTMSNLANQYTITDYHMGQLSWGEETGSEDWDLSKSEELLYKWFSAAIKSSPDAEVGILAQIGDFLHTDGMAAVTPSHGHLLDADTRYQKLVRVAIRTIRRVIDMLLAKHEKVHVIMATGNHDLSGSVWLREMLAAVYEQEPRITIDTSPDVYYAYQHGKTGLFYHHGHKRGMGNVSEVFAAKWRKMFGETEHCYAHLGHRHHVDVKENNLMIVEQHRTIAAPDAHSATGGYMSGRSSTVITYHKEHGEVSRLTLSPDMVR